jgi:nitrate/nitrite transporter NarK
MGAQSNALVALIFAAASTGLIYLSSVYSQALKDKLGFSQDDIETISICVFCGGLFGVIPGKLADRLGPRSAIYFGGALQAGALALYWAVATKVLPGVPPRIVSLCALGFFEYIGSSCITAAVFSALGRLYEDKRGTVVGIGKCWVGMFGGIITQLYDGRVFCTVHFSPAPRTSAQPCCTPAPETPLCPTAAAAASAVRRGALRVGE